MTTHGYLSLTPPLALAVMEGRKTQTMRPMKVQPPPVEDVRRLSGSDYHFGQIFPENARRWDVLGPVWAVRQLVGAAHFTAPYAPGDVLWVREPAECFAVEMNERGEPEALIEYIADNVRRWVPHPPRLKGLIPGRRIPNGCHREAARTYVRVLSVEPRRVQSITEEEARAEGCEPHDGSVCIGETCRASFRVLWDSLYRARGLGWDADPWCWMTRFERVETP